MSDSVKTHADCSSALARIITELQAADWHLWQSAPGEARLALSCAVASLRRATEILESTPTERAGVTRDRLRYEAFRDMLRELMYGRSRFGAETRQAAVALMRVLRRSEPARGPYFIHPDEESARSSASFPSPGGTSRGIAHDASSP